MTVPSHSQPYTRRTTRSAVATAIAALVLALTACTPSSGRTVDNSHAQPAIPPIDLAAPTQIKTATLALG
jgi:hypothetical protein